MNLTKLLSVLIVGLASINFAFAQNDQKPRTFTLKDTLRGQLRPERTCYDVHFYDLNVKVDPEKQAISGFVDIHYHIVEDFDRLQIDLYENLVIDKILHHNESLDFQRKHDAVFVYFPDIQAKGNSGKIRVHYHGKPRAAKKAPWDGGFVWKKDSKDQHWIGVACQGDGASLWWPNKDHLSDEPDTMMIRCSVPTGLTCVANGNLVAEIPQADGYTRFDWKVTNPINNYNVSLNIADYTHFSDSYKAKDGTSLALDYYVLPENLSKAKSQFEQVHAVLAAFEQYFGKYPFWEDGYALVETPYLGMEHQSAIAYGNRYRPGYLGMHAEGFDFDFIIVHETAHEYFGNSLSCSDHAEMWIHESFATYMEALYVEHRKGYEEATRYLLSQIGYIANMEPMLGPLDVNFTHWKGADYYYKGAWMLHSLRSVIDNDELWFECLFELHQKYEKSIVDTDDIITFFESKTGLELSYFFGHYLEKAHLPKLEISLEKKRKKTFVTYQWLETSSDFSMPFELKVKGLPQRIYPSSQAQTLILKKVSPDEIFPNTDRFLVNIKKTEF